MKMTNSENSNLIAIANLGQKLKEEKSRLMETWCKINFNLK